MESFSGNSEYNWTFDEEQQAMIDEIKASMKVNEYKQVWNDDLTKLPSLAEYHHGFQKLINTDFSKATVEEIEKAFRKHSIIFENQISFVEKKTINLLTAFRVRNVGDHEDLSDPKTFSYPPVEFSTKNERLNIKNHPVFYCADHKATGFLESKFEGTRVRYFSCFYVRSDKDVWAAYIVSPDLKTNNPWLKMGKLSMDSIIENARRNGGDKAGHLKMLYSFINWIIENETPDYPISSWIGHYLFNKRFYDMIVYTSKQTEGHQCNIAFRPAFVDKYMKLEVVFKVNAERVPDGVNIELLQVGENINNKILWRGPNENDQLFFEKKEFYNKL
ncbi:MAG: RES domain-containing protein [Bacteroidetes bacterium]|nr:RES domain-containing protein [Bacteroidota bacterium]